MRTRASYLAVIVLLVGFTAMHGASAGNLSFLDKSPLSYFKPDDMEMMRQNALKVLDDSGANAKQTWSNANSGASGWAQVRSQFKATDGATCKRLRIVNKAKGLQSDATYTVCKSADRDWVINTDATPAH
jgi:17 kDa common-antigen outer membrane protein